jgi:hypothetical protein
VRRPRRRRRRVVLRHHPAHHHPAEIVETREDRRLHRAADILEVDVDAVWAGHVEAGGEVAAVVDRRVEAELLPHEGAFRGAARDADGAGAANLRELPTTWPTAPEAAETTSVSPVRGWPDILEPDPGGEAGHAEHAERGGGRRLLRVEADQRGLAGGRRRSASRSRRAPSRPPSANGSRLAATSPTAWHSITPRAGRGLA